MVGSSGAAGAAGQGGTDVGETAEFVPCPSATTACAIMPLGDSITFGFGSSGGGYRVELFRQALANQQNITFVGTAPANGPNDNDVSGQPFPRSHQGHSGFSISGGAEGSLAGLVDAAIDTTRPNIVLLMIGTNDINGNIDVAQAPARLGRLLDQITNAAPDALLVVAQIVPTTNPQTNTRVQAYNAAIPGLVQSRVEAGKHVVLVDMFTPFISNTNFAGLMGDYLHPNDAGYVVMGQAWHDAIDAFLPRSP
jgi:lysophospholipase L1-like esterase